jgi:hypothetical protein
VKVLTSERTLSRLKSPRLSQDEVSRLLRGLGGRYQQEIQELLLDYKVKYIYKIISAIFLIRGSFNTDPASVLYLSGDTVPKMIQ